MVDKIEQGTNGDRLNVESVTGGELASSLGDALRTRRKNRGLTLQELAGLCGLSQPFLSQLENGKATPSLIALHHVAEALGSSAQELLQPAGSSDVSLVRGGSAGSYELGEGARAHFLVEGTNHQLGANVVTAEPGSGSECDIAHDGFEMIYVLEGTVSVSLQDHDTVELGVDDAYTYSAGTPHSWHNESSTDARFLFVSTPPSF